MIEGLSVPLWVGNILLLTYLKMNKLNLNLNPSRVSMKIPRHKAENCFSVLMKMYFLEIRGSQRTATLQIMILQNVMQ